MKTLNKIFKSLWLGIISLALLVIVGWTLCEAYTHITSPISIALVIIGTIALIMLLGICCALIVDKIYSDAQKDEDDWDKINHLG